MEAAAADKRPSVVLTYSTQGHRNPCGQTMGANGCGEFAILYYGDIDSAESQARTHILNMKGASYQFDWVSIIRSDDEAYYGPVMTSVEITAIAQRQGDGS
ncbi:hypothetical protein [Burkholderia cenocepacia]|uniref:hypothetical protein n=1 Tax=Burkholderia cenocepacia TaxID=95486 RepID=UPI001CF1D678|nr:hypothetical protein [Burkholderia cenocepacia]MCA8237692.1 hypothetical protein [Burkholderia cenocepacia]